MRKKFPLKFIKSSQFNHEGEGTNILILKSRTIFLKITEHRNNEKVHPKFCEEFSL